MKKLLLPVFILLAVVAVSIPADTLKPLFDIDGVRLTKVEMQRICGTLFILDIEPSPTIEEFDYSQTPYDPDQEHCDIIAQNQADDLGLDTRDQSGSFRDYNKTRVKEIYEGYPDNRSSEPPEGTSGYYFTSSGSDKEHMGTYTRTRGSQAYTRNMNRSFRNTEMSANVPANYKPPGVASQVFVPLPRLPYFKRFHR